MGFGYLLIGYVVSFVIYITAAALNVGSLALLLGYALMLYGLWSLTRYQGAFAAAKWLTIPLLLTALYSAIGDACTLFLWQNPIAAAKSVVEWCSFVLIVVYHFCMLYGVRMIATDVGLPKIATLAASNTMAVGLYAALCLVGNMPFAGESIRPYLTLSVMLFNLVFVISDIVLLLQCAKNICAAGDEDMPDKPSRFAWINRMIHAYSSVHESLNEKSRADGEAFMQRRMKKQAEENDARYSASHQHSKKKKKKKKK